VTPTIDRASGGSGAPRLEPALLAEASVVAASLVAGHPAGPALEALLPLGASPSLFRLCAGAPPPSAPALLEGLGSGERPAQVETLTRRAREEARRFTEAFTRLTGSDLPADGLQLMAVRSALLRLLALAACGPALLWPEGSGTAPPSTPGARERLVIEVSERPVWPEWPGLLPARNPAAAAADPAGFARFAACLADLPRLALALRDVARAARARRPAPADALAVLEGALAALAPHTWAPRAGAPAAWFAYRLPDRTEPGAAARLAAECDAALEAAGLLWESQQSPPWALAALASLVFSRLCSALSLCQTERGA
jgi:hypothetical protein